ncbi:hypothetical protein BT96DRAFT_929747, partial [Gymnopus androsaceus JB14]
MQSLTILRLGVLHLPRYLIILQTRYRAATCHRRCLPLIPRLFGPLRHSLTIGSTNPRDRLHLTPNHLPFTLLTTNSSHMIPLSSSRSLRLTIPIHIRCIPSPLALMYTHLIILSSIPSNHRTSHPKTLITIIIITHSIITQILRLARRLTFRPRLHT